MPSIAVLIPHYNNLSELIKSIQSISEEDIKVDLLIVDDGSEEKPNLNDLQKIYSHGKVLLELLKTNSGIEHALNHGLEIIKKSGYDYVGRLDCGDYCKPNRFKKQLAYLNDNTDLMLLGTWVNITDTKGNLIFTLKHPIVYGDIKKKMFLNSTFVHPSVVFRTRIIEHIGYYPTKYKAAEDYAYFFEIIKKFRSENYPEVLLDYVVDEQSISSTKRKLQVKSRIRIILHNFHLGIYPLYGLARNVLLYFMSRDLSNRLKKIFS